MSAQSVLARNVGLGLTLVIGALMLLPASALLASGSSAGLGGALAVSATPTTSAAGHLPGASVAPDPFAGAEPALSGASRVSGIAPQFSSAPWIANLEHPSRNLAALTSLPNLGLLQHPLSPNGTINPFYVAQPAPLGLTDFGLGATPYSYNTSHILAQLTLNAPANVTDPTSTGLIEPAGQPDGNVGSVYEYGLQLNTVATNISIPGSDQGFFWTQNVLNINDTGIHFVSDTFNMTSATQSPYVIQPGTIYSACGLTGNAINNVLVAYGGVFQCVGGTVPISAASYPITIQLYNNASINAQKRTEVSYGYRITLSGTHSVFTGVADAVVFNNPTPLVTPANRPGFSIDGFAPSPTGLFRDAEIVLVGDIGGDNSVFRSISGTLQLEYSNASAGGFKSVPSAYNFGGDTGETATGIADYWTSSHVLDLNQGPAMLYGLWGAEPNVSVRAGGIHLAGSISPNYGFVFVSNTPPVSDPFGTGLQSNLSWLPTTDAGTFSTWLPTLGGTWTSRYYVQAFADGYAEKNGTSVTHTDTSYRLTLTRSPGTLNAPIYMFGNAQAASVAANLTGSTTGPYRFSNLLVSLNLSFDHVNDYSYASFVMFMAQGVTHPIEVNNTYEGDDSPTGNYYISDYPLPPSQGLLYPAPSNSTSLPNFTAGINIYDGMNDRVTNMNLAGDVFGIQVVLWQDQGFVATNVTSNFDGPGVWVGDSVDTLVTNEIVTTGANGITAIGSEGTRGVNLDVVGTFFGVVPSLGIEGLSSSNVTFANVTVSDGAIGLETGANYGAEAAYDPYYYLPGTVDLTGTGLYVSTGSLGGNISLSRDTAIVDVSVFNGSLGLQIDDSPHATVTDVADWNDSIGVQVIDTHATSVSHVDAWNTSIGVWILTSASTSVTNVIAKDGSIGVQATGANLLTINFVSADDHSFGAYLTSCTNVVVNHVSARHHSVAVYVA